MQCQQRTDQLRTLAVRIDGSVQEGEPIPLRNTLFGQVFGMDEVALLRLEVPPSKHSLDGLAARLKLTNAIQDGVRGFHVLGSGNGLRKGKVYAATPQVVDAVHQHFETAEDALAYSSLLFSEAERILQLDSARVTGRGAGDGQGWIDANVLREHDLPVRQLQIRALWPTALAKGTLLPIEGLRSREGVDVLFHETQLKGTGRQVSGPFHLAIRETAQIRSMRSSWTWTQFLDEDIQEQLFERYAVPALAGVVKY